MKFKPFDKVLVRDSMSTKWKIAYYDHFENSFGHITDHGTYKFCQPYDEEEYLDQFRPNYEENQEKWLKDNEVTEGSIVKIIRKAEHDENGWEDEWTDIMNSNIGLIGIVKTIKETGIYVDIINRDMYGYYYPYFVLKVIKS